MATVPRSIRINEELYNEAQEIFEQLGMPMSVGINIFFEYVVRERGLPFALKLKTEGEDKK